MLTSEQESALDSAVHAYLVSKGYSSAASSLLSESPSFSSSSSPPPPPPASEVPLLCRKWVTVARLQKKVMELEASLKASSSAPSAPAPSAGGRLLPVDSPAPLSCPGHAGAVTCASLHPSQTICASSSEDATVKLWDCESGDFQRTLKGHTAAVTCVCWSPDGSLLASASSDLTVKLWSPTDDYACKRTLRGHEHVVSSCLFLSAGSLASASRDGTVKLWSPTSGFVLHEFRREGWVRCLAATHDGGVMAAGDAGGEIAV